MPLIIGIDTGGTNTDGVIIEYSTKRVLKKAKVSTTREDLSVGIQKCLEMLDILYYKDITSLCLSTTLATNAIVEGKFGRTGLILIGGKPCGEIPAYQMESVQGKIDIKGRIIENVCPAEINSKLERFRGKVGSIAVSGYASVRNPEHELFVIKMAKEKLEIPVVCAHELTSSLGFYERTVTAVLNAGLIPLITGLINAVRKVLSRFELDIPIMVVKGDGSLIPEAAALEKPIETILSGPAASVIGGVFLSNRQDAIILDMGGTTTDIANVQNGAAALNREGAKVAGWRTRMEAADICTYGIGGDSWLRLDRNGRLDVGPQKVIPVCVAGKNHPELCKELEASIGTSENVVESLQYTDCFILVKKPMYLEPEFPGMEIMDILKTSPHSLLYISKVLGKVPEELNIQKLVDLGLVERIALTPTDVLHIQGRYSGWDNRMPQVVFSILAEKLGVPFTELVEEANEIIVKKLLNACLQSDWYFKKHAFKGKYMTSDKPVIAIGAPVIAWMPEVCNKLGTPLFIPEDANVANAVGAAVGQIMESFELLIRYDRTNKSYVVYSPWERSSFDTLENALMYAVPEARKHAYGALPGMDKDKINISIKREDIYLDASGSMDRKYVETRIKVTAAGRLSWK